MVTAIKKRPFYAERVKTLDELKDLVSHWRSEGHPTVGITSGVFDILHPGHISFLHDAKERCDKLIVVIASDRTVTAQKGQTRPFIDEERRAQTIAALNSCDAVIISDELYHETILDALHPDTMFKGDDYAGKTIIGADKVGKVELIECNDKDYFSTSHFAKLVTKKETQWPDTWQRNDVY